MTQMTSKFHGTCAVCKTSFPAGTPILWAKGQGARHANATVCAAAKAAAASVPAAPKVELNLKPIATFITAARDRGLKFPKARFLAPNGVSELRLSVAGAQSKAPGSIQVCIDDQWLGRVQPDGVVVGILAQRTDVCNTLLAIAADPVTAAKAYGALMCRCSFCDTALTDEGSVEVGYGPVCAKHWGLPHQPKGTKKLTAVVDVTALENELDGLYASLSDRDEIPAARLAALEARVATINRQLEGVAA